MISNILIGTKFPGKDKLINQSAISGEEAARNVASCSCAEECAARTRGEGNRSLSFAALAPVGKGQSEFVFCQGDMTAASLLLLSLRAQASVRSCRGALAVSTGRLISATAMLRSLSFLQSRSRCSIPHLQIHRRNNASDLGPRILPGYLRTTSKWPENGGARLCRASAFAQAGCCVEGGSTESRPTSFEGVRNKTPGRVSALKSTTSSRNTLKDTKESF